MLRFAYLKEMASVVTFALDKKKVITSSMRGHLPSSTTDLYVHSKPPTAPFKPKGMIVLFCYSPRLFFFFMIHRQSVPSVYPPPCQGPSGLCVGRRWPWLQRSEPWSVSCKDN